MLGRVPCCAVVLALLGGGSSDGRTVMPARLKMVLVGPGGSVVEGAEVYTNTDPSTPALRADRDGNFDVALPESAESVPLIVCPLPPLAPARVTVARSSAGDVAPVRIEVGKGCAVRARVSVEGGSPTTVHVTGSLSAAEPDTEVLLKRCQRNPISAGAKGAVTIAGLPTGNYSLTLEARGY